MVAPPPNRAGIVCFNRAGEVLIISALGKSDLWVFPKGHIEKDEEPSACAERECGEEAGICAIVDGGPIGSTVYEHLGEQVRVEWYGGLAIGRLSQAEFDETEPAWGFRTTRWVRWQIALEMLSFPDLRQVLCWALSMDDSQVGGKITLTNEKEIPNDE